jgi:hypothetical protein
MVDVQDRDGGPADTRNTDEIGILPSEVVRPRVVTGVVETDNIASIGIDARDVGTLPLVAPKTRECQVRRPSQASMLLGDDVVYLERMRWCACGNRE